MGERGRRGGAAQGAPALSPARLPLTATAGNAQPSASAGVPGSDRLWTPPLPYISRPFRASSIILASTHAPPYAMQTPSWSPPPETSTDAVLAKEATIRDILALQSSLSRASPSPSLSLES